MTSAAFCNVFILPSTGSPRGLGVVGPAVWPGIVALWAPAGPPLRTRCPQTDRAGGSPAVVAAVVMFPRCEHRSTTLSPPALRGRLHLHAVPRDFGRAGEEVHGLLHFPLPLRLVHSGPAGISTRRTRVFSIFPRPPLAVGPRTFGASGVASVVYSPSTSVAYHMFWHSARCRRLYYSEAINRAAPEDVHV